MSTSAKRFLIILNGRTLGSNVSVEGASSTALRIVGEEMIAILDSRTALVVARVGGVS